MYKVLVFNVYIDEIYYSIYELLELLSIQIGYVSAKTWPVDDDVMARLHDSVNHSAWMSDIYPRYYSLFCRSKW